MFFDSLPAKDVVGFELLNVNVTLPEITTVRSEQCVATSVQLIPQPIHPKWKLAVVLVLLSVGLATTVYFAIWLLQVLISSR
jgi:hypothetical protein